MLDRTPAFAGGANSRMRLRSCRPIIAVEFSGRVPAKPWVTNADARYLDPEGIIRGHLSCSAP
jgi:hypothetical protein